MEARRAAGLRGLWGVLGCIRIHVAALVEGAHVKSDSLDSVHEVAQGQLLGCAMAAAGLCRESDPESAECDAGAVGVPSSFCVGVEHHCCNASGG